MKFKRKMLMIGLALIMALSMLAGCGKSSGKYEVLVNNDAGEPVPDVTIQFCSDTECTVGTTDENGIAAFEKEAGSYTVHVQNVPEGYAEDNTEYTTSSEPGTITIVLKRGTDTE